jgi:hypothetical protein
MQLHGIMSAVWIAIAAISLSSSVASAGEYVMDEEEGRAGLTIGIGVGAGHLECAGEYCNGVTEAGGLDAHAGVVFRPYLAVVGDVWAMAHTEDRLTVSQSMATIGPRVWLLPRLWLSAGIGVARASYNYDAEIVEIEDSTEWNPAGMAAFGVELLSGDKFALDVQMRTGTGFFNDGDTRIYNLSLGIGANWY